MIPKEVNLNEDEEINSITQPVGTLHKFTTFTKDNSTFIDEKILNMLILRNKFYKKTKSKEQMYIYNLFIRVAN